MMTAPKLRARTVKPQSKLRISRKSKMSKQDFSYGAAKQYVEKLLGGPINEIDSVVSISSTASELLKGNGDRVGLIITNLGAGQAFIAPSPSVPSANLGIPLAASGGNISMVLIEDFTFMSRAFNAVVPAGGPSNIYIIEYLRFTMK